MQTEKRKNLIAAMKTGAIIVVLAVFAVLFTSACTSKNAVGEISITVDGQVVESYEAHAGGAPFNFGYTVSKSNVDESKMSAVWSFDGMHEDSSISQSGMFAPGLYKGNFSVKVSVTYDGKTTVKAIPVSVKSRGLKSIEATVTPHTQYTEGQTFNPDGLVITGIFEIGSAVITGYHLDNADDPLRPEDKSIRVRYSENGSTATAYIPITVTPRILQGIRITELPRTTYTEGEVFDSAGMTVTANYEYLSSDVFNYSVSKITPLTPSDKAITIEYEEYGVTKTATVEISVTPKSLQSITVTQMPYTVHYIEGQTFSAEGLLVTANYEFTTAVITDYAIDKTNPLVPSDASVTVGYTENGKTRTTTVNITVASKTFQSLTVEAEPAKTEYIEGELFDPAGMVVVVHYEYISETVTGYTVDKTERLLLTDTAITIGYTYGGVTKTTGIVIAVNPKTLQSITVSTLPAKTEYVEGQSFDGTGMVVTAVYEFLSATVTDEIIIESESVLMLGDESVTIFYTERGVTKTATVTLTINRRILQSVTVTTLPDKVSYIEGETFSAIGLVLTANYEYLNYEVTEYTTDKTSPLMPSDTSVTFSYTDNSVTKTVSVAIEVAQRTLQRIEITTSPSTTAYVEGQTFDATGMIVTAYYEYKSLVVTDYTVDTVTPLTMSDTVRVVSYTENGVTMTVSVTVTMSLNLLDRIEITAPANKTAYSAGESLNTVGLVVIAHYTNGTQRIAIGWTTDKTAPLSTTDTLVTITFIDDNGAAQVTKTIGYEIIVTERVLQSITITALPNKLTYLAGEYFNLNGLVVTANYSGGTTQTVTGYSITPLNRALETGDNSIVVSYDENGVSVAATINITVTARVLTAVEIVSQPNKTEYKAGELFDAVGLIVRAAYNGGAYTKNISAYSLDKAGIALSVSDTSVVVSYTENGITQTANIPITVTTRNLLNITVANPAVKLDYTVGEYFDMLGLVIVAHYSDSPDSIVITWTHNKMDALNVSDNSVVISYLENGVTKTVSFVICVTEPVITDKEVLNVIALIGSLPDIADLTLVNADAVRYVKNLYETLSQTLQSEVFNYEKLASAITKIEELIAAQPPIVEPEYNIYYAVYGDMILSDITFGGNPSAYKNSDGNIPLNAPVSVEATGSGYYFVGWLDGDTLQYASVISAISGEKTYYAVFELTETVNIAFRDYSDKTSTLYSLEAVERKNAQGSYEYVLTEWVNAVVFTQTGKIVLNFYVVEYDGAVIAVNDGVIVTDYGEEIIIYIVTAEPRTVTVQPETDATLNWAYSYVDDNEEEVTVYASYSSGGTFAIPVGAEVTVYVLNPLITDIKIDGVGAGLLYPAREYTFTVLHGATAVAVTFEYYVAPLTLITFTGINTKIYVYNNGSWNGTIPTADLNDIAFMFGENNDNYLNKYRIGETLLYYEDLAGYVFSGNATVTVERVENKFSISFVYDGGVFEISGLRGRQTIGAAIEGNNLSAEITNIYTAIFDRLVVYLDDALQTPVSKSEVETQMLLSDITLYITPRAGLSVNVGSDDPPLSETIEVPLFAVNPEFDLSTEIQNKTPVGYILVGVSEFVGGELLSEQYLEAVIRNLNGNIALYAAFIVDPDYIAPLPPVDYMGNEFVGVWTAAYGSEFGLVSAILELSGDGEYNYIAYVNGILAADMYGEYRLESGEIIVYSVVLQHEYQLIAPINFNVDIRFVADNLLIADMFIVSGMIVKSYRHLLVRGEVKPTNYLTTAVYGEYSLIQTETDAGGTVTQSSSIILRENGTATITVESKLNGETIYTLDNSGYYRITQDGIVWFISNGEFGILDISALLSRHVKSGQNYASVNTNGTWIAVDTQSWDFANFIELDKNGDFSAYRGTTAFGANYKVLNEGAYEAFIQIAGQSYTLSIEFIETNMLRLTVVNLQDGTAKILTYNKVEEHGGGTL